LAGLKQSTQCNTCHENPKLVKRKRKFEQCEDCRREHIKERLAARRVLRTVTEGGLIEYNDGTGWRVAYIVSFNSSKTSAKVQPIGPIGKVPDTLAVSLSDIKSAVGCSPSMPTVQDYYRMTEKKKVVVLVADHTPTEVLHDRPARVADFAVQPPPLFTEREQASKLNNEARAAKRFSDDPVEAMERNVGIDPPKKKKAAVPKKSTTVPEKGTVAEKPKTQTTADGSSFLDKPVGRTKHAPVDLTEARRLYETGVAINDIVEAVKGTRAAFDVKKLVRKTFKELGILKD
jgi:hypothetical protein